MQNMISVFERCCYRRMLRISWMEDVANEVFNRANTTPTLIHTRTQAQAHMHARTHACTHTLLYLYMCLLLTESTISRDLEFALEPVKHRNLPVVAHYKFFGLMCRFTKPGPLFHLSILLSQSEHSLYLILKK